MPSVLPHTRREPDRLAADKLRGGYYTPEPLAKWLCAWAIRTATDRVMEPSCGDGNFITAAAHRLRELGAKPAQIRQQLTAIEVTASEASKARSRLASVLRCENAGEPVVTADFFAWVDCSEADFDVAVGNPPFIRYQNFPEPSRSAAMDLMEQHGLHPNRLTNIWVPFVVGAAAKLRVGGRMAFVLPAELLQVTYAGQLRRYLADNFAEIEIVACNDLFFAQAEQEVVLLLAQGKVSTPAANSCSISLREAATVEEVLLSAPSPLGKRTGPRKLVDHDTEKWLKYFLTAREIAFMRGLKANSAITTLSSHGEVDVGVVTGNNDFFVLTQDQVAQWDAHEFVMPLVGRSAQLTGARLRGAEHAALQSSGKPMYLLYVNGHPPTTFTSGLKKLIQSGEQAGVHTGYKCSIRKPWYSVPSVWSPDCFMFRQIHDFPRVVVNEADATSTDTIHRLTCKSDPSRVAINCYTHLTAASAEIEGRSYGGGVLELEPTEAEKLLMPATLGVGVPLAEADRLVRAGKLDQVLDENDRLILQRGIGLSERECGQLKAIWAKMRNRRMLRRKRA